MYEGRQDLKKTHAEKQKERWVPACLEVRTDGNAKLLHQIEIKIHLWMSVR